MRTVGPVIVRRAAKMAGTRIAKGKPRLVRVQQLLHAQYGTVAFSPKGVNELTAYVGVPLRGIPRTAN